MAKILFLAHRLPFPPNKGDKIRAFHELAHLAQKHDIWLGAAADDPADLVALAEMKLRFRDIYIGLSGYTRIGFNLARAGLDGTPLSVARFYHPGLMHWCENVLRKVRPDLVFVFSSATAQFVLGRMHKHTKLITDFVDADAEKWRAYKQASRGVQRWLYSVELRRLVHYEAKVAAASAAGIFVSKTERDLFAGFVPNVEAYLKVVPNGVDTDYFCPMPGVGSQTAGNIVFSGTMNYKPNIDAVTWFARDILPLVRNHVPGAYLSIVGAKPTNAVLALAKLEGILVTGFVSDMRPYLQQACAIVAPLRIARGIQNKVLEGMAMARPVVATPQALDGIMARPDIDLLIAKDAPSFAEKVTDVLLGRAPPALGANARATVIQYHSWSHHLSNLDGLITEALHATSRQAAADEGRNHIGDGQG